jgi:uncharacterized protein YbjT (DUF2867 family)
VHADLDDPGSVRAAVAGADGVIVLSPHHPRQHDQQSRLIDAALDAGATRVVKLSGLDGAVGPDSPSEVGRLHWSTERHLHGSGATWTVVRPAPYMHNALEWLTSAVRLGRLMLALGDATVALVHPVDVGAVLAASALGDDHAGRTYVATGPAALTLDDVADVLSVALHRRLSYVSVPPLVSTAAQHRRGVHPWHVEHERVTSQLVRAGAASRVTTVVDDLTGRPARTLAQFLAGRPADVPVPA